jgi:hypothetical protein
MKILSWFYSHIFNRSDSLSCHEKVKPLWRKKTGDERKTGDRWSVPRFSPAMCHWAFFISTAEFALAGMN